MEIISLRILPSTRSSAERCQCGREYGGRKNGARTDSGDYVDDIEEAVEEARRSTAGPGGGGGGSECQRRIKEKKYTGDAHCWAK